MGTAILEEIQKWFANTPAAEESFQARVSPFDIRDRTWREKFLAGLSELLALFKQFCQNHDQHVTWPLVQM